MQWDWGTELSPVPLNVFPSVSVLVRQKLSIPSLFEDSSDLFVICQHIFSIKQEVFSKTS